MRAVWLSVITAIVLGATAVMPSRAQDAAELSVRVNRMENQIRQLSGQIEQLQFENRRLTDQLKRFQEDVEFRLSERGGARPGGAAPATSPAVPGQPQRPRRNDAFDPNAQPGAAGSPRQLGGAVDGGGPGSGQPLDLTGRQPPASALAPGQRGPQSVAATGSGTPRQNFDAALAAINNRQYEDAEMGFRQFLQSNPRDRLVPNATYWLGESYFRRSRHKDAAEQYLKVTTDHSGARVAPDAMLKLGMSLNALGARDQACATFAQVTVKYPEATETVRAGVERERRRVRCDG